MGKMVVGRAVPAQGPLLELSQAVRLDRIEARLLEMEEKLGAILEALGELVANRPAGPAMGKAPRPTRGRRG